MPYQKHLPFNSLREFFAYRVFINHSVRPKTTNEWYKEARETEDSPGERLGNIAEESAQAVKEFGSIYPDTAKRTAPVLQND